MALSISGKALKQGSTVYYDDGFRKMIEDHLSFFMGNNDNYSIITISPAEAEKYKGDLYGLLSKLGTEARLHWIVMRMNGLTTPTEYTEEMVNLRVPVDAKIENLVGIYRGIKSTIDRNKK